jgi:hypothetical protein
VAIIMALRGPKMSNQGTAGQRTHVALLIPQEHLIIRWLERCESRVEFMVSYNTGL